MNRIHRSVGRVSKPTCCAFRYEPNKGDKRMNMMSTATSHLTVFEEDALALTQAALEISRAFESKDDKRLAAALDRNLKLWVGIRTLVSAAGNPLPMQIKD